MKRRATLWSAAIFACVLGLLLAAHSADPWQYHHDDNGAWFSAVARAHLMRGPAATRGQDFRVARADNELKPYLHHPPFIGLYLAAVFAAAGSSAPLCARLAVAALHVASFLVFVPLARRVLGRAGRALQWAMLAFACAPMSAFYGKMPDHEVPGLLFLQMGMYASLRATDGPALDRRWLAAAAFAWLLVCSASWHAALCALAFVLFMPAPAAAPVTRKRMLLLVSCLALLGGVLLVVPQLLWAGHWKLQGSQGASLSYYLAAPPGTGRLPFYARCVAKTLWHGQVCYATVPWLLSGAWLGWIGIKVIRRRPVSDRETLILCLGLGTFLYCLWLARASAMHDYQLFYLLPFVAVSSALAASAACGRLARRRPAAAALLAAALVVLTAASSLYTLRGIYATRLPFTLETVRDIEETFY